MQRLIAVVFSLGISCAQADDSIRISYFTDYPMPGASSEQSQIYVSRTSSEEIKRQYAQDIDNYFSSVRAILDGAKAVTVWEPVRAIHADFVKIEISLGSRRHSFQVGYGSNGPQISLDPSELDRRHLEVVRAILRLTTDRMSNHLLKGGGG
jgi:hypothetical protein